MRAPRAPRDLTPEQRAELGLPAGGPPVKPEPDLSWRDAKTPKTRDEFADMLAKACARDLELAVDAKALTDAIKAAKDVFEALYGATTKDEGWGTGLGTPTTSAGSQNGVSHG